MQLFVYSVVPVPTKIVFYVFSHQLFLNKHLTIVSLNQKRVHDLL